MIKTIIIKYEGRKEYRESRMMAFKGALNFWVIVIIAGEN
jgi:hypothetical protein